MKVFTAEQAKSMTPAQLYIERVTSLQINQALTDLFFEGRACRIDPADPAVSFAHICEQQYRESEYLGGMAEAICAQIQAEMAE